MKKALKKAPYDSFIDVLIQWIHTTTFRKICNHVLKGKTFNFKKKRN